MINFSKIMKKAFTLSEVLLVVGIIGLVSALTIPNVNKGVNEEKFALLFRSTIEQLNAAQGKLLSEYGSMENATSDCANNKHVCYGNKLVNYLDLAVNCETLDSDNSRCFLNSDMFEIDGSGSPRDSFGYSFLLKNGVGVYIRGFSNYISRVDVDLDGPNKGPNRKGYDIFVLENNSDSYFEPSSRHKSEVTGNDGSLVINDEYDFYSEWLYNYGNMDYLKCPNNLNWVTKHSCD